MEKDMAITYDVKAKQVLNMALKEMEEINQAQLTDMAVAIVEALQEAEAYGDFFELVEKMLEVDESVVTKLEFLISTSFIDRNIHKIEGGRYAN
jgi:predicted transcriptional regulator